MDYSVFRLDDGDLMTVDAVLDRFENKVEVSGAVYRPGLYQLDGEVNTVKQLIKKAEGLRGDAFLARVLLDREREDLTHEMVAVDLEGIMNGTVSDIPLQKNDHLYVPGIHDLKESETVSIYGEVLNPGNKSASAQSNCAEAHINYPFSYFEKAVCRAGIDFIDSRITICFYGSSTNFRPMQ